MDYAPAVRPREWPSPDVAATKTSSASSSSDARRERARRPPSGHETEAQAPTVSAHVSLRSSWLPYDNGLCSRGGLCTPSHGHTVSLTASSRYTDATVTASARPAADALYRRCRCDVYGWITTALRATVIDREAHSMRGPSGEESCTSGYGYRMVVEPLRALLPSIRPQ